MKTQFIILFYIIILHANSQILYDNKLKDITSLQPGMQLTYENILQIKISELIALKDAFKFNSEITERIFSVTEDKNYISLVIDKIKMRYRKVIREVNGIYYNDLELENESMYIDMKLAESILKQNYNGSPNSVINLNYRPFIIYDKELLNDFSGNNYGKIFNRYISEQYLRDYNNNPISTFGNADDGIILPYGSGEHAKSMVVDHIWNRIVWSDKDMVINSPPLFFTYGTTGNGYGQFNKPFGIASSLPQIIANNTYYKIYVADFDNNRINQLTYCIYPNSTSAITDFVPFTTVEKPYDIEIHYAGNTDPVDDVFYYVENLGTRQRLKYKRMFYWGDPVEWVDRFSYNGNDYSLNSYRIAIDNFSKTVPGNYDVLGFIDQELNAAIFLKVHPNGLLLNNPPYVPPPAFGFYRFPSNLTPTSIKINYTNPALGSYAYVTLNDIEGKGYICIFKINRLNGQPVYADYLATYWTGKNSNTVFNDLINLETQNGFTDIFTIEDWSANHGFRRYKPGADYISISATDYCTQTNQMTYSIRLTNPCNIRLTPYYSSDGGSSFIQQSFTYINGWQQDPPVSSYQCLMPAGNVYFSFSITIPHSSNPLPDKYIKIVIDLLPQDENNFNIPYYTLPKEVRYGPCANSGGGCPFVYINNGDSLILDNNILHKSEFEEFINRDITDKYKLSILPNFNPDNNECEIQIRELNNDYSYFDKFQLAAIDHPVGTSLGITESNDLVLYYPNLMKNPDYAILNDSDVTCALQIDSSCNPVEGDSSDILIINNGDNDYNARNKTINLIRKTYNYVNKFFLKNNKKLETIIPNELLIPDSVGVILDPEVINPSPIINKDYAGSVTGFDNNSNYSSANIKFSRREIRNDVLIPLGKNIIIDSIYTEWYRDFNLSYYCTTDLFYGGYNEVNLNLVRARHSALGDVLNLLTEKDNMYAEMDNNTLITLNFANTEIPIPDGWIRDYVFITEGRYEKLSGQNKINSLNNNLNNPKIFKLHNNYPNPFNPVTKIKYDLPIDVNVSMSVYDLTGKEILTLVNENKLAGYHEIVFDGSSLASGIYVCRILIKDIGTKNVNYIKSIKLVLIK